MHPFRPPRWRILPALVALGVCLHGVGEPARADVFFDGTVGPGGPGVAPPLDEYTFAVDAERGEQAGGNLFHSFSDFSVGLDESVILYGEGEFLNVFLRVSSPFDLNGAFLSQHAGADILVLSPQGIRIGPAGAFVDLPAGLTLSTAAAVLFPDGRFPASGEVWAPGGCCAENPTALSFAGAGSDTEPAGLEIERLEDPPDIGLFDDIFKGLRLLAGTVSLKGRRLGSSEAMIRVVATGRAPVEISLDPDAAAPWLEQLGPDALIEMEGTELDARLGVNEFGALGAIPGGRILLEGGQIRLTGGTQLKAGGDASGPAISLRASDSIQLAWTSLFRPVDVPEYADPLTAGPGVEFEAPSISWSSGPLVEDPLQKTRVRLFGAPLQILADQFEVSGGAYAQVVGQLPGGGGLATDASDTVMLHVVATDTVVVSERASLYSLPNDAADGGDVHVEAGSLDLLEGGQVRTDVSEDRVGGDIQVDVDGRLRLSGVDWTEDKRAQSGLLARADPTFTVGGSAGSIRVRAARLEVLDGALISASALETAADAGSIAVEVDGLLRLAGQDEGRFSEISIRTGQDGGGAGSIDVTAGRLEILDGTFVTASSLSDSPAGDISLYARQEMTVQGAGINAESIAASTGGGIVLGAGGQINLLDSAIETNVRQGEGSGGDIAIGAGHSPQRLVLNGAEIVANARQGDGGNIDIAARYMLKSFDSEISASSREGVDGLISINAPEVEVAGRVEPLPVSYLDVTALLQAHCAARRDAGGSSFTLEGRPGTPPPLDGYLPSSPGPAELAPPPGRAEPTGGGSVRRQLDGFDLGCGRDGRLAVRD